MSAIQLAQLGSVSFNPTPLFTAFQLLGETTTLHAFPTNLGVPVAVAGGSGVNPIGLIDNRVRRLTTLLLGFAMTAADGSYLALDITGFSEITSHTGLYLPTKFFGGVVQAGSFNVSTALGEATAFLADNFSTKTFAGSNISYIEPADNSSMALLMCDMRGSDYIAVRLAAGAATAAVKAQVFYGFN